MPETTTTTATARSAEDRALETKGTTNSPAVYRLVARVVRERHPGGGTLVDVGCGTGNLRPFVRERFDHYVGVDVVRHDGFPDDAEFARVDMDTGRVPRPDGSAQVVAAVETIEHVENPRAFVRELARLTAPGGLVIVTTPNQLSLLSKLGLVLKNQFPFFQEAPGLYPAHLSALLEIDLVRIARECGLVDARVHYTGSGRIPGVPWHWPRGFGGRAFSDNVLLEARRP
ncbi:MAG TPA: methyltransferase domain-containing protein [Isosphaeraceae bacterium]|jgi:SAM-dependent methyltransferase|nr:methyltransferase domain-containing protein [Isosphaeraceae bacterium]